MLAPKRMIPALAAATIPLTGTACSDPTPAENLTNAIHAFCMKAAECQYYETESACLEENEHFISEYVDNYSGACVDLVATYFQCRSDLTCAELESGDDTCYADIADDFDRECG